MEAVAELVAGRELDALVAEKIMGWREVRMREPHGFQEWRGLPPDGFDMDRLPFYSADIDAAWQVVEKLAMPQGFSLTWSREGWEVFFPGGTSGLYAETAPLAICLAALAAVDHS